MPSFPLTLLGIFGLLVVLAIVTYNRLVVLRNRVAEAWADIDVQLKRRYDLIPNLVATVKGYARHEKTVFDKVTKLRAAALSAGTVKEKARAEHLITEALKSVFAVAENYPVLKASDNYRDLQEELTDTEDKIAASRRFYNGVTRDYNTALESFPTSVIARYLKFSPQELFELKDESTRDVPKVSLS
ncbi:LemA family protein [Candidatus Berkelbacteria bacterium]|nr:LemA family protein [Candidatus Berkelbacteria bacterium]